MYTDFAARLATSIWPDFDQTPARSTETPAITDVETVVIDGNFPWTIVTVETDAGVTGIGEAYPSPGVHEVITDFFGPVLEGENPLDVERLYHLMREALSGRGSQDGIGTIAISGVELALWDAAGKILDQPVYQLLGGKMREEVRMYADCHAGEGMVESALNEGEAHGVYKPEAYARAARAAVDDGFESIKFDLDVPSGREIDTISRHFDSPEIEHKRRLVEAVTDEVGAEAEVAVDLHWNFSSDAARKLCHALESYDLAWVEDPLPPENGDAMATLNRSVEQPLLTGENRYGRHGFRDLVEQEAVSFVAPDIPKTGGIAETKKIAELADTYYMTLAPHNIGSPVATMAGVHVGATVPNFLALEFHARDVPWWDDLVAREEPLIQDGYIEVPDTPGLGIELDWDVVEEHRA
ncbi:D-gluconate dehydratase (plasmid) [Natrialba magadii ATCC 43099]|uniref:D-gluconate dehydratase n=1 Tax=Natrialba magadii (strain ATCC 43099 / DSM 3394 / CCM 3739 / CIP 104546 / IAM 13178 / JCM 8861 / NBRC 102185 / NCIMB 2190 / MS3) TaxID=547559 RepID=D3T1L8_NATMM|nr:mandelate racemase/muconate lactonizing enzyme family protein [Natrialba magadii]ADD07477.1 D-gluconate dehydratase [Natrialba magadii ATCC 43099]ELY32195.1 mandelate racemase/muconate lactonizing protein [Natrialba magadii ATCC 43099]